MALALLAAACGVEPQASPPAPTTTAPPGVQALLRCEEVPLPAADPGSYRDTPKYVGNEMPTEEVRAWASQYPGFVDIWIDRDHNGWVAAGFTESVAERQTEIAEAFPDDGVVAVEIPRTEADLTELQNRVTEELDGVVELLGTSTDPLRGYVSIQIPVLDEASLAAIEERFSGEPVCVEGLPPEAVVEPGPQPQAGDGWRLLVDQDEVGEPYMSGIAWDEASLAALVDQISGLGQVDADVDWENEVVIWFGAVHGSSCPNIRLDDVIVEGDTIRPLIVDTDNAMACTADAIGHTYLVAVDREGLPSAPFYIAVAPELAWSKVLVEADLRQPGSVASPDQVGPDPSPDEPAPEGSGVVIEPGYPWDYTVDLACGFEAIGEINSYHWITDEEIPASWAEAAESGDTVVVEVLLHEGPDPILEVTYQGETATYQASNEAGC